MDLGEDECVFNMLDRTSCVVQPVHVVNISIRD